MTAILAGMTEVMTLAQAHGLTLDASTVTLNEAGLDFQVAMATAVDGQRWVLRRPRREDVSARLADEARILEAVKGALPVAVPDWRIVSPQLVAYPLLPGRPGLTLDPRTLAPVWHIDPSSPRYAVAFGRLLARLHALDARPEGMVVESPEQVRARWREDIATVCARFEVAASLQRQWAGWLSDDDAWPPFSVFTHGELYPAHVLVDDDDDITAVIDWTTARVSDPGRDFVFQHAMASPESFARTVEAYVDGGGRVWPGLATHCAGLWSAAPVQYALFALLTDDEAHRAAVQAQLNPSA